MLGVAVDMCRGRLLFGLDGDWTHPMGEAFTGLDVDVEMFPAITAENFILRVNLEEHEFKFGPPDASFKSLSYRKPVRNVKRVRFQVEDR